MKRFLPLIALAACGSTASTKWVSPADAIPHGTAPNARHRLVDTTASGGRTYVLVLATGDEVLTAISDLANTEKIENASFTAIGGVRTSEVGFFDFGRKQYKAIAQDTQAEMLSLVGDIALGKDGKPSVHAHAVLGRSDGSTLGGHLLHAIVHPTLEVFVQASAQPLHKKLQPETDTQVIDLAAP